MWNKRWLILRRSPARLEKYETEAAASFQASSHCAFYDLSRLQVIERLTDRPGICVVLADFTNLHIATDSENEANTWLSVIQQTLQGGDDVVPASRPEMFEVYLMRSPQLQSSGECLLRVTDDCVQILDIDNPQRVQLSWPLGFIRRYSVERGMFSLEAGRKCDTGEGLFMFDSKNNEADIIFERVQKATRSLARARQDDDAQW